jgi:hypothetical protein
MESDYDRQRFGTAGSPAISWGVEIRVNPVSELYFFLRLAPALGLPVFLFTAAFKDLAAVDL